MHLLRPGSRLRQTSLNSRAMGGVSAEWSPSRIASFTYFTVGPDTCFTDSAGVTPASVGDAVWTFNSKYGPGLTFQQATSGARPILRADANGFYYLEWAVGRSMSLTSDTVCLITDAKVVAMAGRQASGVFDVSWHNGLFRPIYLRSDVRRMYGPGGSDIRTYGAAGTSLASHVTQQTGTGSVPTWNVNGASVSQTGTTGTPGEYAINTTTSPSTFRLRFNATAGGYDGELYGFGFRTGGGTLTAEELSSLDTFQRGLYTP